MVANENQKMDSSFDPNRICAIENKSNTFVAHKATNTWHRRQSFGFASLRAHRKDDYCDDVIIGKRLGSYSAAPLQRCQSDVKVMMMKPQKSINRNGTFARNQFRGIKRDVLESQTQRIIRSMTVSIFPNHASTKVNCFLFPVI